MAPANNYQYQGDYAEFDDDLGWNDFMLRSYDAQIGRFLQSDPYDQFSSGYVGMGNDPGNLIDEDGGWGNGIGCAATAGMSGYGGMAGGATSIVGFINNGVSASISMLNNAVSVLSTVNGINDRQKIKASAESLEWTEKALKEIFKQGGTNAGKSIGLLLTLLLAPSDANSGIDDTFKGLLERQIKSAEDKEDFDIQGYKDERVRYVTYYMIKFENGNEVIYSGRTSGPASERAADIVKRRENQHRLDLRKKGYGNAIIDQEAVGGKSRFDAARMAIRGREQQLIDRNGRARSEDGGKSGNDIRGVSKSNRLGYLYHQMSNVRFKQELNEFTGLFKF